MVSLLVSATALFAQNAATLGRAYRESPTPARRVAAEKYAAGHKNTDGALAHLTLGIALFEQKQFSDAIPHLRAAQAGLPKLADYTGYYLAASELEAGDAAAAERDAASVRSAALPSPFAAKAWGIEGFALAASGSPQTAIRSLQEHFADVPHPDGDLALAMAFEAAHDLPHAAEYYQRVYYEYPTGDQSVRAAAALQRLHDSMGTAYPNPTPQQMIARGNRLLALREFAHARTEFQSLAPQLSSGDRDRVRVGIGASQFLDGDVSGAYSFLRALDVSDPEASAERLYYLVECAKKLNDDDQMMEAVKKLNAHYADSLWRFKALVGAANRFLVSNQFEKYTPLYKAAYESFPNQPQAASCHWKVAWDAYIHRKHDARHLLREHLEKYPEHPTAGDALYFLGRLSEAEPDYAAAHAYYAKLAGLFPNYYYGILAHDRLTRPNLAGAGPSPKTEEFLRPIAFPVHAAAASQPDAQTTLRIARSRLLRSAGLPDLADAELRFGAHNSSQPYLLAVELGRAAGTPHESLRSMKNAAPDYLSMSLAEAPPAFWQYLFPMPYRSDLVRDAQQRSLDPFIVAALIRQESEFNPQALSPAHAYGLTQVVPSTGRALARRAGVRRFSNRALFQPAVNLKLGTYYLRSLLDQNGGKWEQTLASYNAGKSRVDDWLTWNSYQEPAEFIESIPFTETREYVQAVLRNAALYRQIYAGPTPGADPAPKSARRTRSRKKSPIA